MDPLVHDIRDTTQAFVDDSMIASATGLERRVHALTKHSPEPVLKKTEPWEGVFVQPVSVVFAAEQGLWRMWYATSAERDIDLPSLSRGSLHLAVSDDGVAWRKEPLGVFELPDGSANNICVFEDGRSIVGASAIFDEPDCGDPAKRYKMITYRPNYYLAYSADGIRWRPARDEPVWTNGAGDGLEETSFFMHDPVVGKYRGYMRVWRRHQTIRKTSLGESDDLTEWTGPKIIWEAQPHYGIGAQIYGMHVHQDAGLYWAFPWIFYSDEPADPALRMTMRLKLAWSRDGVDWNALAPETDVVPMGAPGAFDCGMMLTVCPAVLTETEGRLYYMGANGVHDGSDTERAVGLATWRRGGLVSLRADGDGTLLTPRFLLRGRELRINARAAAGGWVRAELLDDGGGVIGSHGLDRSDVLAEDKVDHVLSWNGSSDLGHFFGQYIMLRLVLHRAEVFSFRAAGPREQFEAPLGPPPVRCGRCRTPPVVDGVLSDDCWQDFDRSGVADDFVKFTEVSPAPVRTRALFTHDAETLYIAVECEEPLTDKLRPVDLEKPLSYNRDDLVEFRLGGPSHGTHVHQLMVGACGATQHCWFSKEAGESGALDHSAWQARVSTVPGRWHIEMAVPFSALRAGTPVPGEAWRLNIIRYRYTGGEEEWSCWQCMYGSPHRNDLVGTLQFGGEPG